MQDDDDPDAEGETLHDRERNHLDRPAHGGQGHQDHEHASHDGKQGDHLNAVLGDHRQQHHGHGAGGSRYLDVAAPEDRRDEARDDRGDQAGSRPRAGRHPEAERQRQGDDTDGEPRHEVLGPGAAQPAVVRRSGEQTLEADQVGADHVGHARHVLLDRRLRRLYPVVLLHSREPPSPASAS